MDPELSIIVPAYNEAQTIERMVRGIRRHLESRGRTHEIIVVADGDDGTREKVAELARSDSRISVRGSVRRSGKGRGVRLGVTQARGRIVGFLDADNKVVIEEIERILPYFGQGYDVVIGSRNVADSRIDTRQPWYRRIGSTGFGVVMHALIGLHAIRDTQCGFKFFRREVAKDLFGRQQIDGYMFDVEVLHLAERAGYRIREVGVGWKDDGDSRLDLISGNWQNVRDLMRIRLGTGERSDVLTMPKSSARTAA